MNIAQRLSLRLFGYTIICTSLAYASLTVFSIHERPYSSILWLPAGLLLAACLLSPPRQWPAYALVTLGSYAAVSIPVRLPFWIVPIWWLSDLLAALLAARLFRRFTGGDVHLWRIRDGFGFFVVALLPASAFTAAVAVIMAQNLLPHIDPAVIWWDWISAAYFGYILITPLAITFHDRLPVSSIFTRQKTIERILFLLLLGFCTFVLFGGANLGPRSLLPLFFLSFPFLVFAAVRYDLLFTTWMQTFFILEIFFIVIRLNPHPFLPDMSLETSIWWLKGYVLTGYISTITLLLLSAERRRSDQMHLSSEQRLFALIHDMPAIIIGLDAEGGVQTWNREFENISRYRKEDDPKVSLSLHTLLHHADNPAPRLLKWLQDGIPFREQEISLLAKTGEERIILWSNISVIGSPGESRFWLMGIDVTEKKKAEHLVILQTEELQGQQEELTAQNEQLLSQTQELTAQEIILRESEARLLRSQSMARIGSWELDLDSRIMWASDEAFRIYDLDPSPSRTLAYADVATIPLPEFRQKLDLARDRLLHENRPYDVEFSVRHRNGIIHHLHSIAEVMRDDQGRPRRIVGTIQDITERKTVENALLESEARYRSLFNYVSDAILVLDSDTYQIVDCNETCDNLFGYQPGYMLAKSIVDVSAEPEATLEALRQRQTHIPIRYYKKRDGSIFPVEISLRYTEIEGSPVALLNMRDISERIEKDEALRARELLYRTLFEVESDALFLLDGKTGQILDTNRAASTLYGYSYEEFQRMKRADITAQPSETPRELESGLDHVTLVWHRRKDGTIFPTEITTSEETINGRKIHLAAIRDISERVRAEDLLRRNNDYLTALYDTMLGLINHLNRDVLFENIVSQAAALMHSRHGYICLITDDKKYLMVRWSIGMFDAFMNYRLSRGEGLSGQVWVSGKAGFINDYKHWPQHSSPFVESPLEAIVCAPLKSGAEVTGVIGVAYTENDQHFTQAEAELLNRFSHIASIALENARLYESAQSEILERRRVEEEIAYMNLELEKRVAERTADLETANKELEAFSYSVSHDLRAPLRSIDGFSQVLLEDWGDSLDENARRTLQRVRAAAQRMSALMDDLLNLSRLSRSEVHFGEIDLSTLANVVVAELREQEPHRQVEVRIQDGLLATGDERLIRVVLENLLSNAWKFSARSPGASIEFLSKDLEGERVFFVRDNGAGFNMAYAHKLFGAFQRLHSDREYPGTGIGLATVQRVIHRHNGRVWAESEPGKGATFYFTLNPAIQE